jgi:hypothetical protein
MNFTNDVDIVSHADDTSTIEDIDIETPSIPILKENDDKEDI